MRIFLITILFFCVNNLFAQKPIIDSIAYKQWPSLEGPIISKNGQYIFYNIENVPIGGKTLVVQSTNGKWKKEFTVAVKGGQFADKYFLFVTKNDSLGMLILGTDQIKYIPNITRYSVIETKEGECMAYTSSTNSKILVLRNFKTNKERTFADVDNWSFDKDVLVLFKSINGDDKRQSINLADIATGQVSKIWEGFKPENLILDMKHKQLAFSSGDCIWYYHNELASAICIADKNSSIIEPGLVLGSLESFSKDGKFLLTSLKGKRNIKPKNGVVEIWSYTDLKLQTEQDKEAADQKYFIVINLENHRIIRLQQKEGEWFQFPNSENAISAVALVEKTPQTDAPWSTAYKFSWDLISFDSGERKRLYFLDDVDPLLIKLSPCGKYIIYFDKIKQDYFSYEIGNSKIRNLTKGLMVSWGDMLMDDRPGWNKERPRGMVSRLVWLKNDKSVLVYDRYDIWRLDPLNIEKPVNLTNGYGKKNEVIFSYTTSSNVVDKNHKLYLTAFNNENKNSGFFQKKLDKRGDPELLQMGKFLYETNSCYVPQGSSFPPIKAKDADMYIVRRMGVTDAPNYFSTKDFKIFTRLSNLQPQRKYNWYITELHHWKSLDGRTLKGILYKPENFDPNKRYPVIFHYYERKSDGLNAYMKPEVICNGCNIDIPTYVSKGYLVFSPDIYYKVGDPMQGTYDAVISAANYVSHFSFVNAKKMGLQGCSWGGIQTNYLVTHTNLFAAAESSSGLANFVSSYGSLQDAGTGTSEQDVHENGQIRIGGTLWGKSESYIKNSSIFSVDKATTPLLLMHTKKDGIAGYPNIMEFFTGLRRMGKKAWMLVYSEGNHGIGGKEAEDFSIRMMQFFDHYLKDEPAPLWMLDGVCAENRSWKAGLELDTKGRTPGPGLLTADEQFKVESMMTRKPITITLK